MKIYHNISDFKKLSKATVTIGTFDGVHLGHRKILNRLKQKAYQDGCESVVISFWPHPRAVLKPAETTKLLSTLNEKIDLLKESNPDHLLIIPFTKELAETSSLEFIQKVLVEQIGTTTLVIGYDHKFGKNREGGFQFLKENSKTFGFDVEEIPREDIDTTTISSTNIRKFLASGDVSAANILLGRPYSVQGVVIEGDKIGRKINFPTANLRIDEDEKLLPGNGVYTITADLNNEKFYGMANIGFRPTVKGKELRIEAHLFNFNRTIYSDILKLNFISFIREEKKFESLQDLESQLMIDKETALQLLSI